MVTNKMKIEVVYAVGSQQEILELEVEDGTTIRDAIESSGILDLYPDINLAQQKVGVFNKIRQLNDIVKPGDRIEIYRPLLVDPKEARRRRVKKKNSHL